MNLIFAGTPEFAVPTLAAAHAAGHRIAAVYTQPDRPAGRGRKLTPSPVKEFAVSRGWELRQPQTLHGQGDAMARLACDAMVVVAYGLILPAEILAIPKMGCLNVHASLLPRWRGAAPIPRAIEAGDSITGVSIMRMDEGIDTGPVYAQVETPITVSDTSQSVEQNLAMLGAQFLVDVLSRLDGGSLRPESQQHDRACYAQKIGKKEALIDWSRSSHDLHCKIRAFNPRPVAVTHWHATRLRIWNVAPLDHSAESGAGVIPGTVLSTDATAIRVATGTGVLGLTHIQTDGGRVLSAMEFLHGHRIAPGDRFS